MALAPARPAIKFKTGVKIPASLAEGPGIDIARSNGIFTIGLDYASLTDNAGIPDPTIYTLAMLNTDTGEYEEAPLDQVRSTTVAAVRTPRGDADYTILTTDRVVALTAALTASRTWSLPTGLVGGTVIEIADEAGGITSTNTLTITATGAETINGASSFVLNVAYAGARFVYDGTSKYTVELVGTTGIAPLAVSNAKLANMAALTVKANATNGSATPTDVAAGTDGYLFKRTGTALTFGQAITASLSDGILSADAAGLAKMADGYLAASAGGLAKMADGFLSADAGGRAKMGAAFFSADATGLGKFADGFLTADATGRAKMADRFNTFAKLPAIATERILGRTTASSGDIEELTAAQVRTFLNLNNHGQCYLAKSGANLVLSPLNGDKILINGVPETIPSAGVSLAPTGLSTSTLHYIYAYMNAGTMTLEASTTARATDSGTGVQIKNGDATRTLVGMAYVITGPAFVDADATRYVVSWFNPQDIGCYAQFTADRTVTGAPWGEVNSEIRNGFITFSNRPVTCFASGAWTVTGASLGVARIGYDGTAAGNARNSTNSTANAVMSLAEKPTYLTEGLHYATLEAGRTGGTNVIFVGSANGNVSLVTTIKG